MRHDKHLWMGHSEYKLVMPECGIIPAMTRTQAHPLQETD